MIGVFLLPVFFLCFGLLGDLQYAFSPAPAESLVPHSGFNASSRPAWRMTSPALGAGRQAPTRHRPSACLHQTATTSPRLPQLGTGTIPDQIAVHRNARPDCRRDRPRWTRCGAGRPDRFPPSACEGQTMTAASRLGRIPLFPVAGSWQVEGTRTSPWPLLFEAANPHARSLNPAPNRDSRHQWASVTGSDLCRTYPAASARRSPAVESWDSGRNEARFSAGGKPPPYTDLGPLDGLRNVGRGFTPRREARLDPRQAQLGADAARFFRKPLI